MGSKERKRGEERTKDSTLMSRASYSRSFSPLISLPSGLQRETQYNLYVETEQGWIRIAVVKGGRRNEER